LEDTWSCSFCGAKNEIFLDAEEIPTDSSIDYMLTPAPSSSSSSSSSSNTSVIFVIDVSGSMCVTSELAGIHSLKGVEADELSKLASLNTDGAQQWIPNQNRNVTYISRLQAVKAAVSKQIVSLAKEHPERRVGLITFNGDVSIIGDAFSDVEVITGNKLNEYETLVQIGKKHEMKKCVKETKEKLLNKLFNLQEMGPTALGPALAVACGLASRARGSDIVLCTDGLANVGIGQLELKDDDSKAASEQFYQNIGDYALRKGVTISVIGIQGSDCRIEDLGVVTEKTNGEVNKVDPLNVVKEFSSILSKPIIATNASVKVLLHKGLFIRDVDGNNRSSKDSVFVNDVGNVTAESSFTLEYGIRTKQELEKLGIDPNKIKTMPFQLQITYTRPNGMKCMRVIAQVQNVTTDREKVEREANVDVLGMNCMQQAAAIAQQGYYTDARFTNFSNMELMKRVANTDDKKKRNCQIGLLRQNKWKEKQERYR